VPASAIWVYYEKGLSFGEAVAMLQKANRGVEGQLAGSIQMGLGYALNEQFVRLPD
jgi:hypothetical protein